MTITDQYVFFYGKQDIYSQWHPAKFTIDDIEFNCAEQYMMYQKAKFFGDTYMADKILQLTDPKIIKKRGREVSGFNKESWDKVCRKIVYDGNYAKFSQNKELKKQLLCTGERTIVEASPYDTIWGIGLSVNDVLVTNEAAWRGTNWLGQAIMSVRETLKKENKHELDANI